MRNFFAGRICVYTRRKDSQAPILHDCRILLLMPVLTLYLYFRFHAGGIRFGGVGWIRPVYFALLISHTTLAAVIVPLVLITLTRALRKRFDRHRAIARWTLPIWLYVSITGVIVYWLLYVAYTPIWPS
jgi:uncharacterized membrane protein YozB (DUF420 family)